MPREIPMGGILFMSKKDFVVGLDIGTTKICCIVGEVSSDSNQIDIIGYIRCIGIVYIASFLPCSLLSLVE